MHCFMTSNIEFMQVKIILYSPLTNKFRPDKSNIINPPPDNIDSEKASLDSFISYPPVSPSTTLERSTQLHFQYRHPTFPIERLSTQTREITKTSKQITKKFKTFTKKSSTLERSTQLHFQKLHTTFPIERFTQTNIKWQIILMFELVLLLPQHKR